MLKKIISGGQTGADLGGLKIAKELGLETGGWIPKGCITRDGAHPEFVELYSMQEHPSAKYPPRTASNVRDSDGTVRFASNFSSPGTALTLKMIKSYKKPYFDVNIVNPDAVSEFRDWLKSNNITILNVAGNSESSSPGIEKFVMNYLRETLKNYTQTY